MMAQLRWFNCLCFKGLRASTESLFARVLDAPLLSDTEEQSRSPRDAYRRQAVRWGGCGARGRICSLLPGGLGISLPA